MITNARRFVQETVVSRSKTTSNDVFAPQRYDIELSYKQGKHMCIADTLSREYLKTNKDEVKTQDEILLVRSNIEVEVEQINMAEYCNF